MAKVTFDYSKAAKFISENEVANMESIVANAKDTLVTKKGAGNDFLGWIDLPVDYDKEEFEQGVQVRFLSWALSCEKKELIISSFFCVG